MTEIIAFFWNFDHMFKLVVMLNPWILLLIGWEMFRIKISLNKNWRMPDSQSQKLGFSPTTTFDPQNGILKITGNITASKGVTLGDCVRIKRRGVRRFWLKISLIENGNKIEPVNGNFRLLKDRPYEFMANGINMGASRVEQMTSGKYKLIFSYLYRAKYRNKSSKKIILDQGSKTACV